MELAHLFPPPRAGEVAAELTEGAGAAFAPLGLSGHSPRKQGETKGCAP